MGYIISQRSDKMPIRMTILEFYANSMCNQVEFDKLAIIPITTYVENMYI